LRRQQVSHRWRRNDMGLARFGRSAARAEQWVRLFTARHHASAAYAVVVCPSVCPSVRPSVTSRYCIETTKRTELAFATQASFQLSRNLPWDRWKQLGKVKVAGTLNRTEQVEGLLFNYQQGNPMVGLGLEPFHGLFPPICHKSTV